MVAGGWLNMNILPPDAKIGWGQTTDSMGSGIKWVFYITKYVCAFVLAPADD